VGDDKFQLWQNEAETRGTATGEADIAMAKALDPQNY
jgi:hypothetical protein